ncbi:hypothetical protein ONS95_002708 [Cadophora gregata]|uniref:uncharacterized protein n=1 Tax=Cadophora gregata TaxID=51156 RepID=UPI0026DC9D2D|nr:uncharacterized protein ONS95_002708 [Cadophora gregata]KAK0110048.1 hypothetical protein ONS95_002708 [Cadophora gregata]KAK0110331.1 hypothetical protein ONS96_001947 [Cadophora gregata f. sp. sojae]
MRYNTMIPPLENTDSTFKPVLIYSPVARHSALCSVATKHDKYYRDAITYSMRKSMNEFKSRILVAATIHPPFCKAQIICRDLQSMKITCVVDLSASCSEARLAPKGEG